MSSLVYDPPQPEPVEPTQTNEYPRELELLDSTYACAAVAPMEEHAQRANDLQNWWAHRSFYHTSYPSTVLLGVRTKDTRPARAILSTASPTGTTLHTHTAC